MEFTAAQIAHILEGKVEGNSNQKINTLSKIQEGSPNSISFLSNLKYENFLYDTQAGAVIINEDYQLKEKVSTTLIRVKNSYTAFSTLLEEYHKLITFKKTGIEQPCFVGEKVIIGDNIYRGAFSYIGSNCKIGNNVKIYPQVYIGDNVTIGNNTILYAGSKIYADCVIGSYCTIQSGAIIGSDGFGFAPLSDGSYKTIPQIGNVILEDHVDIGANTVIDCATMGSTIIRKGVKLDNLIQIAHNVEIGKNTVIASQSGVSGSTKLGENCVIGGQVGVVGHIEVANRTSVGAQSGISRPISEEGKSYFGSPAVELKQNLRTYSVYRKLPELLKRIEELEEKVLHLLPLES
ncbi:MAG: UDP-3-O-(3-hydroxymyristoyl)glucosamine N-acyltransferase [Bacteroidetes bacterium]|nr:MAG: UDP-3-O-(3-hydroxymyristoyl)glucosamine N-acyltransferase [Bacteroidota bacterium]